MADSSGELRFDALTREWVNVVGHRQSRPNLPEDSCPFCIGCTVCAEVAREIADRTRIVARAGDWVAWVPYASGYGYGMRFAPRAHVGSFSELDDRLRDGLATLLRDALGRYDRLWPPANETD